jgi:hypothetical protein
MVQSLAEYPDLGQTDNPPLRDRRVIERPGKVGAAPVPALLGITRRPKHRHIRLGIVRITLALAG